MRTSKLFLGLLALLASGDMTARIPTSGRGLVGRMQMSLNQLTTNLRAIVSEDAMTADWVELPPALLRETSNRILNEVKGINRVLYDISTKPPASIEWE